MLVLSRFLEAEWKPALGCTEPASIAYAAALAAEGLPGEIKAVHLRCDPRIYKNCYAVGIPNSGGQTGILWTLAIGCLLPDPSLGLECFQQTDAAILERAAALLRRGVITVEADPAQAELLVDCRVVTESGAGRTVIEGTHTRVVRRERNGEALPLSGGPEGRTDDDRIDDHLRRLSLEELLRIARGATPADRARLREGIRLNVAIAEHGMGEFRDHLVAPDDRDPLGLISQMVFAGVYARMSGANHVVMSAAGSGNKGITCAVPIALHGRQLGLAPEPIDEALAVALLVTSLTTVHLGTLSAICGCSNAAGIGLAAGLVCLRGGDAGHVSGAISNMVGNISGIICDGAKIGCALKAMTAVDAAFRASTLALKGICIPVTDGIVGADGRASLGHLGRIATFGMGEVDGEILRIMKGKLERTGTRDQGNEESRDPNPSAAPLIP